MWGILVAIKILLCFHASFCEDADKKGLKSVIVLYRHGDRSPIRSFPKDEYYNEKYWPMGFGELTNEGKLRHYNLGKWLRNTYKNFLPELYSPKDIYVFATDIDRTLMSASVNLAGLYPPQKTQVWNSALNWQPIPVHTSSKIHDLTLQSPVNCPKFDKLVKELMQSEYFIKIKNQYTPLYQKLSKLTGWNIDDTVFIADLQACMESYAYYDASYIPAWYNELNPKDIELLTALENTKSTYTPELAKLSGGVLFHRILKHFDAVITNSDEAAKMLMFSGHESTVTRALNIMKVFDRKVPPFASMVIWELYNKNDKYYVKLFFKPNETYVQQLKLEGCDFDCEFSTFKKFFDPIVLHPSQRHEACSL